MNKGILRTAEDLRTNQFYHGTRAELRPGDLIEPGNRPDVARRDGTTTYVYLTSSLDAAIWEAEIAVGEGSGRVYIVEPIGQIEDACNLTNQKSPGHPWMSCCSREPISANGKMRSMRGLKWPALTWSKTYCSAFAFRNAGTVLAFLPSQLLSTSGPTAATSPAAS